MPGVSSMELQDFFPYRLAVLSEAVSRSLAQVYADRFALTRDAWRVLAALAAEPARGSSLKTREVIERTTLDKMQASRAVRQLEAAGHLQREPDPGDGRGQRLRLTAGGRALYRRIVPAVTAREAFLLAELTDAERQVLDGAIDKVLARARALASRSDAGGDTVGEGAP